MMPEKSGNIFNTHISQGKAGMSSLGVIIVSFPSDMGQPNMIHGNIKRFGMLGMFPLISISAN